MSITISNIQDRAFDAAMQTSIFLTDAWGQEHAGAIFRGYIQAFAAHLSSIIGPDETSAFLDRASSSVFAAGQVLESEIMEAAVRGRNQ